MAFKPNWRHIDTGNPDELVFRFGGGWVLVTFGILLLGTASLKLYIVAQFMHDSFASAFVSALCSGRYAEAFESQIPVSILSIMAALQLLAGAWLILGRKTLGARRALHSITIEYSLRNVPLYTRVIQLHQPTSLAFEQLEGWWRFLQLDAIYLNEQQRGSFRLHQVPRAWRLPGLQMARQLADFLGVPFVSNLK
ncbi:MAG TPA: hypothetical protein VFC07_13305 [Verrucomicrobiae bacterium]|nr:hypothetical protein [Verrucomicrobiae bacterium]